ncbi:MAG: Dabb family protein [Proteobacteria bacterium]|nr:Dabb family protein [Pseudomonadota bacterium]
MLTHLVLFTLEDPADIERTAAVLRGMQGKIPALKGLEVGTDILPSDRSAHIALITRFEDEAGLSAYAGHPVHLEVLAHMKTVVKQAVKVDFSS